MDEEGYKRKGDFVLSDETIKNLKNKGYTMKNKIGTGSYASVHLAASERQKGDVALKIMQIAKVGQEFINKFLSREIEAMKCIKKHANIVEFYDHYKDAKYIYIVIEYCVNGDIYEYIRSHRMISEQQACFWFKQLIEGISYCHEQGFAHRDLKCENLLLDVDFNVKITDFGFACRIQESVVSQQSLEALRHTFCGSILYASPELLQSQPYNPMKSDIWSCGVVLFIFLFGFYPLDEQRIKDANETLDYSVHLPDSPEVSQDCKDLLSSIFVEEGNRSTTAKIKKSSWFKKKWPKTPKMDREYFKTVNIPRQDTFEFEIGSPKLRKSTESTDSEPSPVAELRVPRISSKEKDEGHLLQKASDTKIRIKDLKSAENIGGSKRHLKSNESSDSGVSPVSELKVLKAKRKDKGEKRAPEKSTKLDPKSKSHKKASK